MEQSKGSSSADPWQELKAILVSTSFLVGAAILVGSVAAAYVWQEALIALLGFVGYLVAGLLARTHPWATGVLLGLVNALAAAATQLLPQPKRIYDDPWTELGAELFASFLPVIFVVGILLGVLVAGLVGSVRARAL